MIQVQTTQLNIIQTLHCVPCRDFGRETFSSVWSVTIKWSKVQYQCLLSVKGTPDWLQVNYSL